MSQGVDDEQARARARVGQVLKEKWTLDKLLGVGGMGAVYAATHRNKKRGALKILHPELSVDAGIRQRFLREGYVANSVGHRGAVEVFDDDIAEDGAAYLVMELLEGESVEARWERREHKLPALEVLALFDQLLDTLAEAHAKDIVHRDLKPENLFLQKGGTLKVLDFGIARLREAGQAATATQTGNAMGTPAFMAPEQARGRWDEVDGRTDLWAVGASMFTLITGRYVHGTGTVNEVMARAITQPPPSLASVEPSADPALVAFVDKAMAYAPADRFANARDMQNALREVYHALAGRSEMRVVQPSLPDDVATAATVASAAVSNATLTTGRPLVTSSGEVEPKRTLPGWLPVAVGAGLLAAIGLLFVLRGSGESPAEVSSDAPAAAPPLPPEERPVAVASDAPSPPSPQPATPTVDLQALPALQSAAPKAAAAPRVAAKLAAGAPSPAEPVAAPAAPKPAPSKPPPSIFKKRQ